MGKTHLSLYNICCIPNGNSFWETLTIDIGGNSHEVYVHIHRDKCFQIDKRCMLTLYYSGEVPTYMYSLNKYGVEKQTGRTEKVLETLIWKWHILLPFKIRIVTTNISLKIYLNRESNQLIVKINFEKSVCIKKTMNKFTNIDRYNSHSTIFLKTFKYQNAVYNILFQIIHTCFWVKDIYCIYTFSPCPVYFFHPIK